MLQLTTFHSEEYCGKRAEGIHVGKVIKHSFTDLTSSSRNEVKLSTVCILLQEFHYARNSPSIFFPHLLVFRSHYWLQENKGPVMRIRKRESLMERVEEGQQEQIAQGCV